MTEGFPSDLDSGSWIITDMTDAERAAFEKERAARAAVEALRDSLTTPGDAEAQAEAVGRLADAIAARNAAEAAPQYADGWAGVLHHGLDMVYSLGPAAAWAALAVALLVGGLWALGKSNFVMAIIKRKSRADLEAEKEAATPATKQDLEDTKDEIEAKLAVVSKEGADGRREIYRTINANAATAHSDINGLRDRLAECFKEVGKTNSTMSDVRAMLGEVVGYLKAIKADRERAR